MIENKKTTYSIVAEVSGDTEHMIRDIQHGVAMVLPVRDNVLFPGTVTPILIGRESSIKTLKYIQEHDQMLVAVTQKQSEVEFPTLDDVYDVGVAVKLVHFMQMPDGNYNALLQAFNRIRLVSLTQNNYGYEGYCDAIPEFPVINGVDKVEYNTTVELIKHRVDKICDMVENFPPEIAMFIRNQPASPGMINHLCGNLPLEVSLKEELLLLNDDMERATKVLQILNNLISLEKIKLRVEQKTHSDIDQQQREYFLNQEIKNLQAELGNKDEASNRLDDLTSLREEASKKNWGEKMAETFEKEVCKLARINIQSPDYNIQLSYLQTILHLPWNDFTNAAIHLDKAQKTLDQDHYGMEKVKERILEHLAVLKLRKDMKSPILCLYGPPGVGKTSLGKSIAAALNRKYVRISLGGVHDESEIRGHRRTYIGAMPGRIIKGMEKAGSSNPVFILDEIDKVSTSNINGDPSSALLEVLDPEQNNAFHDNYLDLDYDLSHVMFIATANDITSIPRPLLDRMELIEVSGYLTEEKIEIGKRHLVPKKKYDNGLDGRKNLKINKAALEYVIENYTRESGVRSLEKQIDKLFRKVALKVAKGETEDALTITPKEVEEMLGKPMYSRDKYQGNDYAGVVTGLAWTSVGGEILFIETSLSKGKAGKLTLTGNLGDVMKESAMLALEYIKAHTDFLKIDHRIFDNYNIHIHVPEGAVPKDGPSAGITMATSIASALTQRKVRNNLAMTGEITLRGKVLPVGGIKEKILAAKRAGITTLILCKDNKKDIDEISDIYLKGLTFHYVENITDVWDIALLDEKVSNAIVFDIAEEKDEVKG